MALELGGIIPSVVTPFGSNGEPDDAALREEVRYHLEQGVRGLVVCGSTGEGQALSLEESVRVCRVAAEAAGERVPVLGGIIRAATADAIRLATALRGTGLSGLQVAPPLSIFGLDSGAAFAYYEAVGRAAGLPLVVFNPESRAWIGPELIDRFAAIPGLAAVKQSGRDLAILADLLLANRGRLPVVTAIDDLLFPAFLLGAVGAIAPISTVIPELCVGLWNACRRSDLAEARSLHERILVVWRAVYAGDPLARIKAAAELRGRPVGPPRPPQPAASAYDRDQLRDALRRAGAL